MAADTFHDFVRELFRGVPGLTIKRMFGGAGIYSQGVMFGLIADETIHIKVDDALKDALTEEGSGPFVWEPKSGPRAGERVDFSYWRLPEAALDDPELAQTWARKAIAVAQTKMKTARKRKS
ncbi:MAG TPA: TfoX/Sxy family protein [Caulobacterales bacterium]|nr:TfoX/Sxy family protein [Caulobacterales bacterium]